MFVPANVSVPTTGTHTVVGMCHCQPESKDFEIICSVHKTNIERYVAAHANYGFSFFAELPKAVGKRDLTWYKIPALYKTLRTPGVEFAFWIDSDSLFMTLHKPLPEPSPGKFFAVSTHNLPRVRSRAARSRRRAPACAPAHLGACLVARRPRPPAPVACVMLPLLSTDDRLGAGGEARLHERGAPLDPQERLVVRVFDRGMGRVPVRPGGVQTRGETCAAALHQSRATGHKSARRSLRRRW